MDRSFKCVFTFHSMFWVSRRIFFEKKLPAGSSRSGRRGVEFALYSNISDWFGRDRFAARKSGAGRIHAAVSDAYQLVVLGHSGRGFDLRLLP
jgi:hypothetical protein